MTENKKAPNVESSTLTNIIPQIAVKDSFVLYTEQKEVVDSLSDEDAGKLFKGIYEYVSGNEPQFNNLLKCVFIPIRQQLDRNAKKYAEIKEKRRIAGTKGGKQKIANQANANFANQSQANQAVNVYVNDNVNVNDNKLNNNIINISKQKIFKKPSLKEVQNYILEIGSNIDANIFIDFYAANGWKVGKNPMKDWKATIRGWDRRNKKTLNNGQQEGEEYVYNPYC